MSRLLKEFLEKNGNRNEITTRFRTGGPVHHPLWECFVEIEGLGEYGEGNTRTMAKELACERLLTRLTTVPKPRSTLNPNSKCYVPGKQQIPETPRHRLLIVRTDLPHPREFGAFADVESLYFFGPPLSPGFPMPPGDRIIQKHCIVGQNDANVAMAAIQLFIGLYHQDFTEIFLALKQGDQAAEQQFKPTIQAAACFGIRVNYYMYT